MVNAASGTTNAATRLLADAQFSAVTILGR